MSGKSWVFISLNFHGGILHVYFSCTATVDPVRPYQGAAIPSLAGVAGVRPQLCHYEQSNFLCFRKNNSGIKLIKYNDESCHDMATILFFVYYETLLK